MPADTVSFQPLTSGEIVAMQTIEVTSIPHFSIVATDNETALQVVARFQLEFLGLLNETYQTFRSASVRAGFARDIALELLWKSTAVPNQPFRAGIRTFLSIRAIGPTEASARELVQPLVDLCHSTLELQKYEYEDLPAEEFLPVIASIDGSGIQALVKEESSVNLQNQLLPYCYSYDPFPISNTDFSRMLGVLTEYPDCAVSVQLMPTILRAEESAELDRTTQMLETLSKGIADQSIGNISFALAEKQAQIYRYYAENKARPFFGFNILVFGSTAGVTNISNRLYGQLSTGNDSSASLKLLSLRGDQLSKDTNLYPLPWAAQELILNLGRSEELWNYNRVSAAMYRLPYVITGEEAAELFHLPVGSDRVGAGLRVNESGMDTRTYASNIINAGDIIVGRLRSSSRGDTIGFSLKDLAKHMLVVGTPGSGKTTFSVSLLDRLWKQHHIPFLVIEPAKNEYRALVQSIPELQVFTPGKNFISPFVFNPFVPPKNVKLETYKSTLKTAFAAGVSMTTPLDKIFEEAINNCYSDFRWLDSYTRDDKGRTFNISDFIRCFQQTFDEIGYTGDARNIGRAGVVRLNSLVNLFDNYYSIPLEDILQKPTIIELAAIENSDQKALLIALLLLSILAYVNANYVGEGGLRNVILLEEAHVLLDADTNAGQGDANPSAIAQGLVKRMLAEIRSYGVGLVIADQSPRKVSTDVVALTDMKVVFRLVESEDKQIIADSTNMTEIQVQRMSKLKPGEAFLFFNKLDEPEEVITPDYRLENNISITLSDEGIHALSTYWNDKGRNLRPYPQCDLVPCCREICDYTRRLLAREIARRIFVRNFRADTKDFEVVRKVFGHITQLVEQELNDEELSRELVSCVKVHLWRRIRYGTKIPIKEIQIENSLKK